MASAESIFDRDVLPEAIAAAKAEFRGRWDRGELVDDTIHEAWIGWSNYPDAPARSIANFAVLRVKCGRHFRQSSRSFEGPNPRRNPKPLRVGFRPEEIYAKESENPALVACFKIDYEWWMEGLEEREREIVKACLAGETGQEIAKRFAISEARVSQIRRQLFEDWLTRVG